MKIAMYWHNGRSLGHTAENAKIATALVNDFENTYFAGLSGAFKGLDMLPSRVDMFKLPSFSNYDRKDGWNYMGNQGLPVDSLFKLRAKLLYDYLECYEPNVFMVNHILNGLYDELLPSLELPHNNLRILTLRGILFDKEKTEREYFKGEAAKLLSKYYDDIIVHIDPNIFSLEDNYDIPDSIKETIHYVGYLSPKFNLTKEECRAELGFENNKRIIVASMAGGQGALDIWLKILEALSLCESSFDKCFFITGPYLEYESKIKLKQIQEVNPKISVIEYVNNMQKWMTASDLFIGAAGSSMLGEIISTSCNAIVIPRQVREIEQYVHSCELSKRNIVRMSSLTETLDGKLNTLISEALENPLDSSNHSIKINGLKDYSTLIKSLYEEKFGTNEKW